MKNIRESTEFFKDAGPEIAGSISQALSEISGEEIRVEFSRLQAFESSEVFVGVEERCFGSYLDFKRTGNSLEGIVVAIFPVFSTKILIELLLKRYICQGSEDYKMKLSAFKEMTNIILSTYVSSLANVLGVKLTTGVPRFVCFDHLDLIRPTLLRDYCELDSLVSIGQFRIFREGEGLPRLNGALLLFCSR